MWYGFRRYFYTIYLYEFLKKLRHLAFISLPLSASLFCKKSNKNTEPPGAVEIKDSVIAQNLNFPWEILWGPDNHIWMTERGGKISRLNPTTGAITPLLTINEVQSNGEGGMLGMVLHPNFATLLIFLLYIIIITASGYKEKVVRYNYNGTTLNNPLTNN